MIFNSVQVVAEWTAKQEDIWTINNTVSSSLNPILFRTTLNDDLNKQDVCFIFELVVYVRKESKVTEWTCGWAQ